MPVLPGRLALSDALTGRGPNFTLGLYSSLLKSYGSSSYLRDAVSVLGRGSVMLGREETSLVVPAGSAGGSLLQSSFDVEDASAGALSALASVDSGASIVTAVESPLFPDASELAYSVTEAIDLCEPSEVIDRCPDSSRTMN